MTNRRSTNFFTRQEQARSNCRNLVVVFIVALFAIIIAIYFAFRLICYINLSTNVFTTSETATNLMQRSSFLWWDPAIFILVFIGVILFIFTAGIIKMRQLQKGGGAVAKMLGGRCVAKSTNIPAERQLLNVVEEMAIAAGIPVPEVYILEKETGINAFAAGLTINDAAVAVTQGALEKLTRDELQGVVAHEFSHILNGDMRLNIQLMGIIFVGSCGQPYLRLLLQIYLEYIPAEVTESSTLSPRNRAIKICEFEFFTADRIKAVIISL
ncbi:MAG: M48 family metalloprotease, partial [Syntrophaceae bacterium]|nr:M48 family metalloprotease [Syntrophaceae bacterium]